MFAINEEILGMPMRICTQMENEQKHLYHDELIELYNAGIISEEKMTEINKKAWAILYRYCPHLSDLPHFPSLDK